MASRRKPEALEPDTTVAMPLGDLRLFERNPRKGNVGAVAASLQANGQFRPIVANIGTHTGRRLEVLKGNTTLRAFRSLAQKHPEDPRWSTIQVHLIDVDLDQAGRIVLVDNKSREKGTYDNSVLAELLGEVRDADGGLEGTGFTLDDLDELTAIPLPAPDVDFVNEDDIPDNSPGRGAPVVSYAIVFDTLEEKATWVEFMNWLKRAYPDNTPGERIANYIENRTVESGDEDEHDAS